MEKIEGIPNSVTDLKSTKPLEYARIPPTKLVMPTMNNEQVVASNGFTCIKYTSTGTVRIEPPLPIIPSEMPINIAAK